MLVPWPGLPKGVKFEPTDADIIEFLEAKCGISGSEPHVLSEEFIRPVTEDVGINYTHPKNLPGTCSSSPWLLISLLSPGLLTPALRGMQVQTKME